MADDLSLDPSGRWGLRYKNTYEINAAGYGNGGWTYELVEVATGRVVKTWSAHAHQSPWDSWSSGVQSVTWDGDVLVIRSLPADLNMPDEEERVPLVDVLRGT